ncbi:mycofactocin biosynthesis peptidyl-dipeptidase MftE [Nocardioides sp. GCM10030258]|uniref:mycofactocin biosynthesis peptidyl-dipeptidase MftE n=1 Tax=unclassified Nocardioides TaxID=2615069 RepID=UPI003613E08E
MRLLAGMRWPEVGPVVVLVPVGSLEQHGPALGLATDAVVATHVTRHAVSRMKGREQDFVVAPTVPYGASGEHEDFLGTISIGHEALHLMLVELCRSASRWARGVVLVNGHGGNVASLVSAVTQLRDEGRSVAWTSCRAADVDAHAGRAETSLMLALAPETVDRRRLAPGCTEPVATLMPRLRSEGVRAVSPTGVLGDPTTATPEAGRRILVEMVDRLVAELGSLDVGSQGRLTWT